MAHYIRRIVSGNQTRFKDHDLKIELNLVYVTDQVIIMGFPASGIGGFYRNHKKDVVKFLESRHGSNYWVFNFCPNQENSYDVSIFGGRVSRYPFPDHHPPPLAVMPLVAREIRIWLSGSSERVAVLHCKAGKGRSGMMACAYLLSLDNFPILPRLERSYTAKQWARRCAEQAIVALPPDEEHRNALSPLSSPTNVGISSDVNQLLAKQPGSSPPLETRAHAVVSGTGVILNEEAGFLTCGSSTSSPMIAMSVSATNQEKSFTDMLKAVLDLHTARRMKAPTNSTKDKEINTTQGVHIPSQRRFLYYWALLLAHEAPKHMWDTKASALYPSQSQGLKQSTFPHARVYLTQIKLRMRETSKIKIGIIKAASVVIGKAGVSGKKKEKYSSLNQPWASISKYDDVFIDRLEQWEVYTRDPQGNMGGRCLGQEQLLLDVRRGEDVGKIFEGGNWDKGKMLRSFAYFGVADKEGTKVLENTDGKVHMYALRPMSDKRFGSLQHENHSSVDGSRVINPDVKSINAPVRGGLGDTRKNVSAVGKGILLDADREVRVKLYRGRVLMGWVFFIPTFHMPQPLPLSYSSPRGGCKSHLLFTRNDIDFPLGIGSGIIDVEIEIE